MPTKQTKYSTSPKGRAASLRYLTKVRTWIDAVKRYYGCANPGCKWAGQFDCAMLDFHHLDSTIKEYNVAAIKTLNERLYAEISKCCILCANCHRLVSWCKLDATYFRQCNISPEGNIVIE